ncbi:tetratricopeptide repeat protein [Fulvivirga sp. 29W222]|uniref:Tetratricopeptide repeat protein n=1 Tax=Fulvivirga marina TaxID=2494733 RepID=A0A937KCG1_9BACT|nr:tetratricopeptide repeat protein [Fulvivirga marina]MBL6447482.1 tetratricopeptide repeat protein [Fulvivirga marina]
MLKTRIILIASAALLVLLIFSLPKVVVDNDSDGLSSTQEPAETKPPDTPLPTNTHDLELSENSQENIKILKEKLTASKNIEKSIIFADSLAKLYLSVSKYDSAAKFVEIIAQNIPNVENLQRAGDTYYEAFSFAMDAGKRAEMGKKAREYYEKVLKESPNRLDIKNNLAMTYLSTSNPMQGIMMLRDILKQDPENEKALFNMGALSMQSNQYDKAIERYSKLVELYPENTQARFFLGVSYMETGQKDKAKEQFIKVKELDDDPQVQATVDSYLEEIE